MAKTRPIYGLMAEFENARSRCSRRLTARTTPATGSIDAFSPIPVEGLAEAVGFDWTSLPIAGFLRRTWAAA